MDFVRRVRRWFRPVDHVPLEEVVVEGERPWMNPHPCQIPQEQRRIFSNSRMSADRQVASQVALILPPYPRELLPVGVTRRGTRTRRQVVKYQAGSGA